MHDGGDALSLAPGVMALRFRNDADLRHAAPDKVVTPHAALAEFRVFAKTAGHYDEWRQPPLIQLKGVVQAGFEDGRRPAGGGAFRRVGGCG